MNQKEKLIQAYPVPWDQEKIIHFRTDLLQWYDNNRRQLPWRMTTDPYKIWVSEIMLQQTQVDTVLPYYERFISQLPTIKSLAEASEVDLLSLWQGLGYYSRVRNMQVAALTIEQEFNGIMPNQVEDLLKLKGIGPYTAGAIASIAFNLPEPAMDGNLIRIISRLFNLHNDISKQASLNQIQAYLYQLIDLERPGDFNQALMDMGATIMTASNPYPDPHPLRDYDASYEANTAHMLPIKTKKIKNTPHYYFAFAIRSRDGKLLMRRHSQEELLTGLWHFPLVECQMVMESATESEILEQFYQSYGPDLLEGSAAAINLLLPKKYQNNIQELESNFPVVKHVFSHRTWYTQLIPVDFPEISNAFPIPEEFVWVSELEVQSLPVSTLQTKLWRILFPID